MRLSLSWEKNRFLVSCRHGSWEVVHVSRNIDALLERDAHSLLGSDLRTELSGELVRAIEDVVALMPVDNPALRCSRAAVGPFGAVCDVLVHRTADLLHLEFEPALRHRINALPSALADGLIARVANDKTGEFFDVCARQVRALTGFDRVMVYRFLQDDSGEVVAEARAPHADTYLGLRFPAFDIPPQARRLYLLNRIRAIPDARYVPVPLVSRDATPLDLSLHSLRSVAPVHLQYLANMGVAASLSVSIVCGDRLWGLVACHHGSPLFLDPGTRSALELFGRFLSLRVTAQQQEAALEDLHAVDYLSSAITESGKRSGSLIEAVARWSEPVRRLFAADGLAIRVGSAWHAGSAGVDAATLEDAASWLDRHRHADVSTVDEAAAWRREGDATWAGLLALRVDTLTHLVLLHREQVATVTWAGEPAKCVADTAAPRLMPRTRFSAWSDTAGGRSAPWLSADLRKARRMIRDLRNVRWQAETDFVVRDAAQFLSRQGQLADARGRLRDLDHLLSLVPPVDRLLGKVVGERVAQFQQDMQMLLTDAGRTPDLAVVSRPDEA
ncbi:MAG: GAF domain-containing protein [Pseudomonadota bacterium]